MHSGERLSFEIGALTVYIGSAFYLPLADRPIRRHSHPCYELVCADMGEDGMRFTVNPPLVEHLSSAAPGERVSSMLFELSAGACDVCSALAVKEQTDIVDLYDGAARVRSLKSLASDSSLGAMEHMAAELRLLFVGLSRSLLCGRADSPAESHRTERVRLTELEEYFNIHLADPSSSKSDLARQLGVSERQLTRILLETYNSNFSTILTQSRMTLAKAMLEEGERTLDQIAEAVGYYTRESFVRAYKKYYGKSPKKDICISNKS